MSNKITREDADARRAAAWLKRLMQHDTLDDEAERLLVTRAMAGDAQAVQKLVLCSVRLIIKRAAPFSKKYGLPIHDLMDETIAGLYEALRRQRSARGFNFANFVERWLKQHLKPLSERMVARACGSRIRSKRLEWLTVMLDGNGDVANVGEVLSEDDGDEDYEDLADRYERIARIRTRVANVMATVGPIQKDILAQRLMADHPETLKQIAAKFGLSRKSVREMERSLKKRLQMALSGL